MALMSKMREYTKVVLILLVFSFVGLIVFEWGMDLAGIRTQRAAIATVNGKEISVEQFNAAYQRELENYRQRTGNDVPQAQRDAMRDQVFDNLVQYELLSEELHKRGIVATDSEIVYYVFQNPAPVVQQFFRNEEGVFDSLQFRAALNSKDPQVNDFWLNVESHFRQNLPFEKFQSIIDATVLVTESQVKEEFLKRNQKASVRYVEFPVNNYRSHEVSVSEKDIQDYYENNQDEFKDQEKRKISYVIYSTRATAADSQAVRQLAQELTDRAREGEDFAELAKTYSEDESNRDRGGDLNFFKRGAMVKPFEEAAFSANAGDIVGPIETQFGVHIINVIEKRVSDGEEEVHARHILLRYKPSSATVDAARDSANYLADQAQRTSWEETVQAEKVKAQESAFFVEGTGFVPGIGVNSEVSRFTFKSRVGTISEVFEVPQGLIVLQVTGIQSEHIKPLEEVKVQIESKLKNEKWQQLAHQDAEKFYASLLQNQYIAFDTVAARDSLEVKSAEPFTRSGFVAGVGRDQEFIGTAFSLKPGQFSKPIKGTRGSYVILLTSLDDPQGMNFESSKASIRSQLVQRAKQQAFERWYADLKEKASIEDNRKLYF